MAWGVFWRPSCRGYYPYCRGVRLYSYSNMPIGGHVTIVFSCRGSWGKWADV
jgi:hypothetical protein